MLSLEESFKWKVDLLTNGCCLAPQITFPDSIGFKKIHLYADSTDKPDQPIPDDCILPHHIISRIRYRRKALFILEHRDSGYQVRNQKTNEAIPIQLNTWPSLDKCRFSHIPLSSIAAFLGTDLLGITPSNYCFYFQQKKECRFCEIFPLFKKEVAYPKAFKPIDAIEWAIQTAFTHLDSLRFIVMTTGNVRSYDWGVDAFIQMGKRLQKQPIFQKVEQVLATLMPPNDLSKLALLRQAGFTKICFPLEVFDPTHFQMVCPGKADYGYENILKALEFAVKIFGRGNVYTNFVYGIQSLNPSLDPVSYDPEKENSHALDAVKEMLGLSVLPGFTLYQYGGYNSIGPLTLNPNEVASFFLKWGELVKDAHIISQDEDSTIFSPFSLSNTLFNDGYRLAIHKEKTCL